MKTKISIIRLTFSRLFSILRISFSLSNNIFFAILTFFKLLNIYIFTAKNVIAGGVTIKNLYYHSKFFNFKIYERIDIISLETIFCNNEYLYDFEGKVKNIIDLGANIGDTPIFFALRYPDAKIYAVEPNPKLQKQLIENTQMFKNVEVVELAVSDKTGAISLNLGECHLGSSFVERSEVSEKVLVSVESLTDFIKNRQVDQVDILKFDIEGAEEYLLNDNAVRNNVSYIAAEIHPDLVRSDINGKIASLNLSSVTKKEIGDRYIIIGKVNNKVS